MSTVITPSAEQAQFIGTKTAAFRVDGPSRKIGQTSTLLQWEVQRQMEPHIGKLLEGATLQKEVSLAGAHVAGLTEKFQNGENLSPQDLASVWLYSQEVRDSTDLTMGTAAEKEARKVMIKKLDNLQTNIMGHLTGEGYFFSADGKWQGGSLNEAAYKDRLRRNFKLSNSYDQQRDQLVKEMYPTVSNFNSLKDPEMRAKVNGELYDRLYIQVNGEQARNMLNATAEHETPLDGLLPDALKSTDPNEKNLAQRAQNLTNVRANILAQSKRVHEMGSTSDFLQLMNIDMANEAEAGLFTTKDIAEATVRFYKLNGAQAQEIRDDPDMAVKKYLSQNTARLTSFVGELHRAKLVALSAERVSDAPETLKNGATKINRKAVGGLTAKEAAHLLVKEMGTSTVGDPKQFLIDRGVDEKKANDLILRAQKEGYLHKTEDKQGNFSYSVKFEGLVGSAKPETIALAVSEGHLDIGSIPDILTQKLEKNPEFTGKAEKIKEEVDRQMARIDKCYTALDTSKGKNERRKGMKDWSQMLLAISMLGGAFASADVLAGSSKEERETLAHMVA